MWLVGNWLPTLDHSIPGKNKYAFEETISCCQNGNLCTRNNRY